MMNLEPRSTTSSRRVFFKNTGTIVAASTLVAAANQHVHAAQDNAIRVALVGCGGRGTGAAVDCLGVENGPVQLVALADVFESNLKGSHGALLGHPQASKKMDVPEDRQFIGFDGYKKAMDCLRPGDIVILATPPGFRWVHYTYAIEKGLNVFMEKPLTVDGPTSGRMLELNKAALEKNLKVGVGLMCRHCEARGELFDRIQNGEIGDLTVLRTYRMAGPLASAFTMPNPGKMSDLMYQIRNFHSFLWLSGGSFSDFMIHNIDECCWMKNAWPVKAMALGGRHYRGEYIDQNFDVYAVEYTFPDGTKLFADGRNVPGCKQEFASFAHGTKGMAVISQAGHSPSKARTYASHQFETDKTTWACQQPEPNPYHLEWVTLLNAIRNDTPYNEVERGVMASAVTSMGRMAAHTGQEITFEQFMSNGHEFAPEIEKLTLDSESPLKANPEGRYHVPMPGLVRQREYM